MRREMVVGWCFCAGVAVAGVGCGVSGPEQPLIFGSSGDGTGEGDGGGNSSGSGSGSGASSTSSGPTTGPPNGSAAATSGSGSPSSGSGGGFCSPDPGDDACTACAKESCCPELNACIQDDNCTCWALCMSNTGDTNACYAQCDAPSGATLDIFDCTSQACPACGG